MRLGWCAASDGCEGQALQAVSERSNLGGGCRHLKAMLGSLFTVGSGVLAMAIVACIALAVAPSKRSVHVKKKEEEDG